MLAAVLGTLTACTSGRGPSDADRTRRDWLDNALSVSADPDLPEDTLQIRLAFDSRADLDLFVTDPLQESLYFARREGRSSGRLLQDHRCDALAPRIEVVEFPSAHPGRYRIGIDYAEPCGDASGPAQWVVEVRFGGTRRARRGQAEPFRFDPVVWEFELTPTGQ